MLQQRVTAPPPIFPIKLPSKRHNTWVRASQCRHVIHTKSGKIKRQFESLRVTFELCSHYRKNGINKNKKPRQKRFLVGSCDCFVVSFSPPPYTFLVPVRFSAENSGKPPYASAITLNRSAQINVN